MSRALVPKRILFSVNLAVSVLFLQGDQSGSGLPWWLWFVLITVLLLLLVVGLVRQLGSGDSLPKVNESAAAVVAEESAERSVPRRVPGATKMTKSEVTSASEPSDGIPAVSDEEVEVPELEPQDDLRRIEGIGPKIAMILNEDGILTFADLAAIEEDRLRRLLEEAGIRSAYVGTWAGQARLAAAGQWSELETYKSNLKAGRKG